MQRRGGMSEEVVAAGIIHGVTSKIVTRFSAIPRPEVTLFHMELARCNQVERPENGSISWKGAREGRRASVLAKGNSDAKRPGIKEKTSDSAHPRKLEKDRGNRGSSQENVTDFSAAEVGVEPSATSLLYSAADSLEAVGIRPFEPLPEDGTDRQRQTQQGILSTPCPCVL